MRLSLVSLADIYLGLLCGLVPALVFLTIVVLLQAGELDRPCRCRRRSRPAPVIARSGPVCFDTAAEMDVSLERLLRAGEIGGQR